MFRTDNVHIMFNKSKQLQYSFIYLQEATYTHCEVFNISPSISASIGSFSPQKYVWKLVIGLHSGPRIFFALLTRSYFFKTLTLVGFYQTRFLKARQLIEVIVFYALICSVPLKMLV